MTRQELFTAHEKASQIADMTVVLKYYINSCKHKNGFGKRIERIYAAMADLRTDLWNEAQGSD